VCVRARARACERVCVAMFNTSMGLLFFIIMWNILFWAVFESWKRQISLGNIFFVRKWSWTKHNNIKVHATIKNSRETVSCSTNMWPLAPLCCSFSNFCMYILSFSQNYSKNILFALSWILISCVAGWMYFGEYHLQCHPWHITSFCVLVLQPVCDPQQCYLQTSAPFGPEVQGCCLGCSHQDIGGVSFYHLGLLEPR